MRLFLSLLLLMATPLWAQVSYPRYASLSSNFGTISVRQTQTGQQVYLGELPVSGLQADKVFLHGVYNHPADGSQTVLLSMQFANPGCFASWALIRLAGNQLQPSALFGGCSEIPSTFIADASGVTLYFDKLVAGFQTSRFRFDGQGFKRFDENYAANTEEGSGDGPLPNLDWRKWVTRPAFEFLLDPQERYRFQYVNSRDFEKLGQQLQASGRMFSDGAFLYGFGCIPKQCQKTHAAFAIRLSNGWPFYVYYDKNGQRQFGGDILSRFPERLRQFYYTGVFSQ